MSEQAESVQVQGYGGREYALRLKRRDVEMLSAALRDNEDAPLAILNQLQSMLTETNLESAAMSTRPNIEELDRLWENANRKRAFDASNPARGIEEQVSATNRYACAVAVAYPELSAYVKALEKEREWQLIETAPKDGTVFWAWWPHWSFDRPISACFQDGDWEACEKLCKQDEDPGPTHWKPLPEPPKETP